MGLVLAASDLGDVLHGLVGKVAERGSRGLCTLVRNSTEKEDLGSEIGSIYGGIV